MSYSDPLTLLPVRGSAVISGNQVKERSFVIVGARSGGPRRETDGHEILRYTFIDGTAKYGEDYGSPGGARSGEVKIKYGGGTAAIFVPLIVDTLGEGDETFFVRFDRSSKPGESQTLQVVIVDRPLSEPAPLPPAQTKPAPAWWPPGFPTFDDTKEASSGSNGGASAGSGGGQTTGSTDGTRNRAAQENAANETTDVSNLSSSDIVPQVVAIDGKAVEKFFFDMSSHATPSSDKLGGSRLPDFIHLLDSDDRFTGGRADDLIFGDGGNDWINGNQGDDRIEGGLGNDIVRGGKNSDSIDLGAGDDWANGNRGDDVIYGGIGDDTLDGGKGDDILWGGDGADRFIISKGFDIAKDFRFSEGDRVKVSSGTSFSLTEWKGSALLTITPPFGTHASSGSMLFEGIAMGAFDSNRFITYT